MLKEWDMDDAVGKDELTHVGCIYIYIYDLPISIAVMIL